MSQDTLPPQAILLNYITGKFATQAVAVAAHLGLADHLRGGPKDVAELAPTLGAHAPSLYRLMRALAMLGLLVEHDGQRFELTPVGDCLRSDAPIALAGMAKFMGEGWHSALWAELLYSVKTGGSAMEKVHGMPAFDWFVQHQAESAVFNDAMTSMSKVASQAVASAYDFSGFRRIADIGGGHGFLLATALKSSPRASGVLFDLPQVTAGAAPLLAEHGVASRVEVASGSFFDSVPAGCDCYMMKHIIHDWHDEACVTLLSNCRKGLAPGGKVLVIEQVVTPIGVPDFSKMLDLEMLVATSGGRERTEEEYRTLFAQAGLRLSRVVRTQSPSSVLEAGQA